MENTQQKDWYNKSYSNQGFRAQRFYPNEELLRFMGRNFFQLDFFHRKKTKILETGCGSCSNLWMIAHEGFEAYGIDISEESILLGKKMLDNWKVSASLKVGSMHDLPYKDNSMDAVIDVFSSYCLGLTDFRKYLNELRRVLKPGGKLFIYTPSVLSDAFINYEPAIKIEDYSLNGIHRKNSPYYGNFYPFRFTDIKQLTNQLSELGFYINYYETITRTYRKMKENFEHISLEAILKI